MYQQFKPTPKRHVGVWQHRALKAISVQLALWLAAVLALPLAAGTAAAQDAWKVTVTPYMWLQGSSGDLKIHGVKAHVDDTFLDVVKSSDTIFGGFVHLDAWREQWGFYLEGNYSYTSTKGEIIGGIKTRVRTGMAILEAGGLYNLAGGSMGGANQSWHIEAIAGVRYVSFNAKIDLGPLSADRTISWTDPLIGLGGHVDLSERWLLIGHADIGGFGIGSKFTTNLYGLVGYRTEMFGAHVVASFGYRGLYINREDSSKNNGADVWLHGPVIGSTFRF